MRLPNFIIVGTIKSGTTSIWKFLKNHPDVFMPNVKETRFFSDMKIFRGGHREEQNKRVSKENDYLELFRTSKKKICGDISNDYFFYNKKSIKNIKKIYKKYNTNLPKIIIILRDPSDQIFSLYNQLRNIYGINDSFKEIINKEKYFIENDYPWPFCIKQCCLSSNALEDYLKNFNEIKVLFFKDINTIKFQKELCDFLKIKQKEFINYHSNRTIYSESKIINGLSVIFLYLNNYIGFLFPNFFKDTVKKFLYFFNSPKKVKVNVNDLKSDELKVKKLLKEYKLY